MPPLPDSTCLIHGEVTHVAVHEAGHAVAAVRLGIPLVRVFLQEPEIMTIGDVTGLVPGGTQPVGMSDEWIPPRPADSLMFLVAGSFAEERLLSDSLPNGFAGDMQIWRAALKLLGDGLSQYDDALGEPFIEVLDRGDLLVRENLQAIRSVALELVERGSLTEDEIIEIVQTS